MYCPTCGADVPESRFCQNCGSALSPDYMQTPLVGQNEQSQEAPSANVGEASPSSQPQADGAVADSRQGGYYQDATLQGGRQGFGGGQVPYESLIRKAPATGFVLVIIGLVLSLFGFSLVTIIPGLVCSIVGLALNARYNSEEMLNPHKTSTVVIGVIGIVVAALSIVFFIFVGVLGAMFFNEGNVEELDAFVERIEQEERSSAESARSSGKSSSSALSEAAAQAFDAKGNVTLYAVLEMAGDDLQDALQEQGYAWVESARAWMAPGGATFEVQNSDGMLSRDEIERVSAGAFGEPLAYTIVAAGYDSPAAVIKGLGDGVEVRDTCADVDGEIVFARLRSADDEEYLAAVSGTGSKQQTVLVFTQDAVEDGLFTKVTGVSPAKSIDGVWKALNAK